MFQRKLSTNFSHAGYKPWPSHSLSLYNPINLQRVYSCTSVWSKKTGLKLKLLQWQFEVNYVLCIVYSLTQLSSRQREKILVCGIYSFVSCDKVTQQQYCLEHLFERNNKLDFLSSPANSENTDLIFSRNFSRREEWWRERPNVFGTSRKKKRDWSSRGNLNSARACSTLCEGPNQRYPSSGCHEKSRRFSTTSKLSSEVQYRKSNAKVMPRRKNGP